MELPLGANQLYFAPPGPDLLFRLTLIFADPEIDNIHQFYSGPPDNLTRVVFNDRDGWRLPVKLQPDAFRELSLLLVNYLMVCRQAHPNGRWWNVNSFAGLRVHRDGVVRVGVSLFNALLWQDQQRMAQDERGRCVWKKPIY